MSEYGPTPCLVLDADKMESNIARMFGAAQKRGHLSIRPHFKTTKMIEVAKLYLDKGAVGLTCATIEELETLIEAGITDLLWAQQPVGAEKVQKVIELNRRARVAVAVDSLEVARPLSEAAIAAGASIPYRIEIDSGMNRAGVTPDKAPALAKELTQLNGLAFEGIFTHEGQLYGVRDNDARADAAGRVGEALAAAAKQIEADGIPCPIVSTGSTPGGANSAEDEGVTEIRPGTFVFMDSNQMVVGSCEQDDCAVAVLATVISRPREGAAIIDAGLKAMSSDASLTGSGYGLVNGIDDIAFTTAFEEHGLLAGPGADTLKVGDVVEIIPNHVCGCVNMWSKIHVKRAGTYTEDWSIVGRH